MLCLSAYAAIGQHHRFTSYSLREGLSQSEVHCILEDSRGNLWMGTRGGGLNKFNGLSFSPYTTFDGLSHNGILCIYEDSQGLLWVGTDNGLNRYDGKSFTVYDYGDPSKPLVVSDVAENRNGDLVVATTKGLLTVKDGKLVQMPHDLRFEYLSFLKKDKSGDLWLGITNKVHQISGTDIHTFSSVNGLGLQRTACAEIMPGNKLLVSCYGGELYLKDGPRFSVFLPDTDIHGKFVNDIYLDSENQLWIGTNNSGIYQVNLADSSITHLTKQDGLSNNHIESIYEDSWGNIWFGTGGSGVCKYHMVAFSQMNSSTGLPGDWIYSVHHDRAGTTWIGAGPEGIVALTDSTYEHFNRRAGFVDGKVRLLFEDSRNRLWLAPEGFGLWMYDSSFHQVMSDIPGIDFHHIKAIAEDTGGYYWVCEGGKGLIQFRYVDSTHQVETLDHYTTQNGMPRNYLFALHVDKVNRVWFGTKNRGAGYIDVENRKITNFTMDDGLASSSVSMIQEDDDGYIWLGGGDGVTRVTAFKSPLEIRKYGHNDGLVGVPVYQVLCDTAGYLWVGTSNGVTRFLKENGELSNPKHYADPEGFTGLETNANAVSMGPLGKVLFGTGQGLMVFQGDYDKEKLGPPNITINAINLFYEPLGDTEFGAVVGNWQQMEGPLELPHNKNHVSFEFFGVSHFNPGKVQYSWILEGFDRDWTPPSNRTDATYSNLPPGHYTFRVKARNSEGLWSEVVSSQEISVLGPPPPPPPFWQETWFKATATGISILILGLIALIWYTRLKRERERIRMERDLLQLEQKALRLQMNPHFIFNALNSIQGLITVQDTKKARYQLAKFSKLMRQILDNSRSQMISLEDEIETLHNYLAIEQFSSGDQFDFEIHVDDELDKEGTAVPPMMIQPFAENAIIHGIRHIDTRGLIQISFERHNGLVTCSIDDNGVGREKASQIKSQKAQSHKSAALTVTQERLDILHGNADHRGMEVVDKNDDSGNPSGTKVIIRFPYSTLD